LKPNEILPGLLGRLEAASRTARVALSNLRNQFLFSAAVSPVSATPWPPALWGLDFLFTLAQFNAAGVNMETGVNHLGFLSWYTPIGPDASGRPTPSVLRHAGFFAWLAAASAFR
jgi:hypothetical protein